MLWIFGRRQKSTASRWAAMILTSLVQPAHAQSSSVTEYPARPVRVVVGFSPGGSNDLIGRMVATKLSERLGKQFVVDNRAGAGGVVGSEIVANAPADGHTLMVISIAHTANPFLYKLKYETEKAFVPIAQLGTGLSVLAVHPSVPAKTVKELLDYARANPGKLHLAHAGIGSFQHMVSSQLQSLAGIDIVQVPYKGGGPATIDVVAGHAQMAIFTVVQVSGHMRSGKLRALAVGSLQRHPSLPDLPTIAEGGLPGYEADNWWGMVGPAGIPKPIVDKLGAEIAAIQDLDEFKQTLEKEGAYPTKRGPTDFSLFLSRQMTKWAKVIKDGNIKPE
jgi:tripartite-type tricarboxylate transporter receptor subunit TctC